MKKNSFFLMLCLFLVGCSPVRPVRLIFYNYFDKAKVHINYGRTQLDTVLSTNESIQIAGIFLLERYSKQQLVITVDGLSDSLLIDDMVCCAKVKWSDNQLVLKRDTMKHQIIR